MLAVPHTARTDDSPTVTRAPVRLAPRTGSRDACAHEVATSCAARLADVLAARRPLHQVCDRLNTQVAGILTRYLVASPLPAPNYHVRSVHACLTGRNSIEASVVLTSSVRSRALATRLERTDGRWICAALCLL